MTRKGSLIVRTLVAATVLWIVPSVGTQGMGTIGQGFMHPDSFLLDPDAETTTARASVRDRLESADAAAEAALGF